MKKKVNRWFDKVVAALLTWLGIAATGCSLSTEYGVPHADYILRGKVTRADTQEPIVGIRVAVGDGGYHADTLYTDANGEYRRMYLLSPQSIKVEDVDGAAGGGRFAPDSLRVTSEHLVDIELGEGWYSGTYGITADFALKQQDGEH